MARGTAHCSDVERRLRFDEEALVVFADTENARIAESEHHRRDAFRVLLHATASRDRRWLRMITPSRQTPREIRSAAKRRMRSKIPELTEALTGRFNAHHAFLARMHLDLIDNYTDALGELTSRIEVVMEPFRAARDLIVTIPGISTYVADVIIAETGADMSRFPTAGHLASWAGTCPGSNESAGRVKSTETRPGNPYLKGALGVAALSVARSKNTYLAAKYRRITSRRGPMKALVALEHAMLIAAREERWRVNAKRVHRLWRDEGPRVPYEKRKKRLQGIGVVTGAFCPIQPNVIRVADFQFDQTRDGRVIKILNVIDEFTREALSSDTDRSIDADDAVRVLD